MTSTTLAHLDLQAILNELFLLLTEKEKEVITKRFSLNNQPRQTLEKIGQKFGVTRERIRQIERIGLNKLRRTAGNTNLKIVGNAAIEILNMNGGVSTEDKIVALLCEKIDKESEINSHIVKLALAINPSISKVNKSDSNFPYYHLSSIKKSDIKHVNESIIKILQTRGDVVPRGELLTELTLKNAQDKRCTAEFIMSSIETDSRIKKTENGYGLMSWRSINPKSIRDKAYIILKNEKKPLHFEEIAEKIRAAKFDKKSVTIQAVHNDLIRYETFVLVGRGLYGLKEWGYKEGTVADIIEELLAKKSPLTKQEIVKGVLAQRHVKIGTISLNLQKNKHFERVGRALYSLDLSKKMAK